MTRTFKKGDNVIVVNVKGKEFITLLGKVFEIKQVVDERTYLIESRFSEIGRDICCDNYELMSIEDFKNLSGEFETPDGTRVVVTEIVIDEEFRKLAVIYEPKELNESEDEEDVDPRRIMSVVAFLNSMKKVS